MAIALGRRCVLRLWRQARVPKAMAGLRSGNIGVMDYYRLQKMFRQTRE